ncbi:Eukaryotic translation initiation factor eIF2A [Carpediemonas membranifera]|uniref:Eukaryotic translation initiation factor eIF2A n=1 Tax=Carpediemonas membranifera TaxID=201153 RepID=A0A8J6B0H6_9EUKA|nr:Eukaryotic translation initiation factor eIF2A [Carpediemonas membranifera]|eukprot:KAG9396680.1 Eukaryotic translation initiation factor eIF2A [Carpediemonas membranifera]
MGSYHAWGTKLHDPRATLFESEKHQMSAILRLCTVAENVVHFHDYVETDNGDKMALGNGTLRLTIKTASNQPEIRPSPINDFIAVMDKEEVIIVDTVQCQIRLRIPITIHPAAISAFSPTGRYLSVATNVRFETNTIVVLDTMTGARVLELTNRVPDHLWPLFHFSPDETKGFFVTSDGIHPLRMSPEGWGLHSKIRSDKIGNIHATSISPSGDVLVVFTHDTKGGPSRLMALDVTSMVHAQTLTEARVFNKSLHGVNEMRVTWTNDGSTAAVFLESLVDRENKSYYGKAQVLPLSLDRSGPRVRVTAPAIEGDHIDAMNVTDVQAAPNGPVVTIIGGSMPAPVVSFNTGGQTWVPRGSFGTLHRNELGWSPSGAFLAVGGFGGLSGYLDIWDAGHKDGKSVRLVAQQTLPNTTHSKWTNDSRYIITATLSPRLRVDNGFKVVWLDGSVLINEPREVLYAVHGVVLAHGAISGARPVPPTRLHVASKKAVQASTARTTAVYVPPSLRAKMAAAQPAAKKAGPELVYTRLDAGKPAPVKTPGQRAARSPAKGQAMPPGFSPKQPQPRVQGTPKAATARRSTNEELVATLQKRLRAARKRVRQCEQIDKASATEEQLEKLARLPGLRQQEADIVEALKALGVEA